MGLQGHSKTRINVIIIRLFFYGTLHIHLYALYKQTGE